MKRFCMVLTFASLLRCGEAATPEASCGELPSTKYAGVWSSGNSTVCPPLNWDFPHKGIVWVNECITTTADGCRQTWKECSDGDAILVQGKWFIPRVSGSMDWLHGHDGHDLLSGILTAEMRSYTGSSWCTYVVNYRRQ